MSTKSVVPFSFRVHRNLRPVLDRIKIPEPTPFVADPFQVEALEMIEESDVLVTAPTGAGKTYIAVKAIEKVFGRGGKSWYASPLKALSNAKFEEFCTIFGPENVGILTGDRKENTQAPVVVGTTEILRNQLYDIMHQGIDLDIDLVVLDEAHYLGDADRGVVWEEVLIYMPARVRLLLLSATIHNAGEICDWLAWTRGAPCRRVAAYERPVPLFPLFLFPGGELAPLGARNGMLDKVRTVDRKSFSRNDFPDIPKILDALRRANLLPAIFYLKSRSDCDKSISMCCASSGTTLTGNGLDSTAFDSRLEELLSRQPFLRGHQHLSILRNCRVGAHHGGHLPHWKQLLEKLMQEGYLDAIFSTSTIAAGVNFPARSVVVFQSDRFNGKEFVPLTATDLLQMTGRAGRRGMDEIGFVLVVPGLHQDPELIYDLLRSSPDSINSQARVNFSMVLNLLLSHAPDEIKSLFSSSLATYQNLSRDSAAIGKLREAEARLGEWLEEAGCGSLEQLKQIRPKFISAIEQLRKSRRGFRRRRRPKSGFNMELLGPGRVFLSSRGTPYVCVAFPETGSGTVEAVRMAAPMRFRRSIVRTHRVVFGRIAELCEELEFLPALRDRESWESLAERAKSDPFQPIPKQGGQDAPVRSKPSKSEIEALESLLSSLPCNQCPLFAPCQKDISHPFSAALLEYFQQYEEIEAVQEQLWKSFQKHFRLLRQEGYVTERGELTPDGLWASKLRLDQPLLISEGIRKHVFPQEDPAFLAALIASFVMDRERPSDIQLSSLVWKYPDLARPFFKMLQSLQRLREHLQAEGFSSAPLPFWAVATIYHWALGRDWDAVREISGMDEGDLAMLILRTADHLRQIESLAETHPMLASTARKAIQSILREPVLSI